MTDAEITHVRSICLFFYPNDPPNVINQAIADLAGRMLHEALEKSKMMDLVPRPPGFMPGAFWLLSQGVQMMWRSHHKTQIYETVRVAVAVNYRSEYVLLNQGIEY